MRTEILIPKKIPTFRAIASADAINPGRVLGELVTSMPTHKGPYSLIESEAVRQRYKLSVICSRCERWHVGMDLGVIADGRQSCATDRPCGGLAVGMGYPEYIGPLTLKERSDDCVVCGDRATKEVDTPDGCQTGYCEQHYAAQSAMTGRVLRAV